MVGTPFIAGPPRLPLSSDQLLAFPAMSSDGLAMVGFPATLSGAQKSTNNSY